MIRIGILYPNNRGSRFDFSYYVGTHMLRSIALLRTHLGFREVSVERGSAGATPGTDIAPVIQFDEVIIAE